MIRPRIDWLPRALITAENGGGTAVGGHADGLPLVAQADRRSFAREFHVRLEVGFDRPHVSPISWIFTRERSSHPVVAEVVRIDLARRNQGGDDVLGEVMSRFPSPIGVQEFHQEVGPEMVVPHGDQGESWVARHGCGALRLFGEFG